MGAPMGAEARDGLIAAMRSCEQTSGITVLRHGEMVRDHYRDLVSHLRDGTPLEFEWRLPDWIRDPMLLGFLPDDGTMAEYHLFHDVGKPACRTVDDEGRQHFPDHAAVSARVWREAGGCEEVAHLIASDMDVHLLKAEGVEAFAARPEAIALLLTGLSEVTANASMFGGIESTSFKIKYKNIEKRGRAVVKAIAAREGLPMAA
jgi:hypothetical protein